MLHSAATEIIRQILNCLHTVAYEIYFPTIIKPPKKLPRGTILPPSHNIHASLKQASNKLVNKQPDKQPEVDYKLFKPDNIIISSKTREQKYSIEKQFHQASKIIIK